ncbi:vacuolar protein sorting-associated protein 28 [Ceraceosorus guamensis]|uniref:Vacuolar protein sorting-associated protein 28 n=1 Tax=Ceraceosorus guamensis TaxID=1522189 RepID=A0A316W8K3_9BASI|nr:vacuolar protein sorting-associated protein 28 [Ceraceosorus guamensis]PWN46240.1 vacuolar protein sorting-associated protein 28 [Ceraceosorus guamensis]
MQDINPYEEARLYSPHSAATRDAWESMATLFSIIVSLEYLERAYVRHGVDDKTYAPACQRLLAQFKTLMKLVAVPESQSPNSVGPLGGTMDGPMPVRDVADFMQRYKMHHTAAAHRLAVGVPATVEHASSSGSSGDGNARERGKNIAETTQGFITFMDAVKLKMRAKDQLHPLLGDLMGAWTRAGGEQGTSNEARAKVLGWLIKLNKMAAADEITDEEARQMLFDVEGAYTAWFASLQS